MKKKKVLIIIAVIIALLAGGIVYAYYATDLFKTDKEIFLSYLGKEQTWENFLGEKELEQYYEKMLNTPFNQNGEISLKVESNGNNDRILKSLNNSTIKIEGKADNSKNKLEEKITLQTSVGVDIPLTIKRYDNTYGIYSKLLNDKYIAIRNENLKALAEKLEIDSEDIPDKIEISGQKATKEDIKTIKKDLANVIDEKLTDEMFSSEDIDDSNVITLKITVSQIYDLLKSLCEELKDNETIKKLVSEDILEQYQDIISEIIDEIDQEEKTDDVIEIKLYIKAKKVTKLEMKLEQEAEAEVVIENIENKTNIKLKDEGETVSEVIIEKVKEADSLSYTYTMKNYNSYSDVEEISATITYKNINDINKMETLITLKIDGINPVSMYARENNLDTDGNGFKLEMNINQKTEFDENITFEDFKEDNSIIINDATKEEIQELISNIFQNEF